MNICFISREYSGSMRSGGIKSYLETIIPALLKRGHNVTIICAADAKIKDIPIKNLKIIRLPFFDYYKSSNFLTKLISKCRSVLFYSFYRLLVTIVFTIENKKNPFDLVELCDYGAEAKFILSLKSIYKSMFVVRLHGTSFMASSKKNTKESLLTKLRNRDELNSIIRVDVISSPSNFMKAFILQKLPGATNIEVISNPVLDMYLNLTKPVLAKFSEKIKIGYIGTISHIKGVKLIIEAVNSVNTSTTNSIDSLLLAGRITGEMTTYLKSNNSNMVKYLGILKKEEVLNLYRSVDVIIIPSYREPFGLVALEALRSNGVVIASDSGALPEIISDNINGYIFKSGDVQSLTNTLLKVANKKPHEIEVMRKKAYNSVNEFSSKIFCEKVELMESKYKKILVSKT